LHADLQKGWDGGRTWINSSTLLGRANLIHDLLSNEKTRFGGTNLDEYLKQNATTMDQSIERFEELLLAVPLRESVRDDLKDALKSDGGSVDQRLRTALHTMSLQPEFQLC